MGPGDVESEKEKLSDEYLDDLDAKYLDEKYRH